MRPGPSQTPTPPRFQHLLLPRSRPPAASPGVPDSKRLQLGVRDLRAARVGVGRGEGERA